MSASELVIKKTHTQQKPCMSLILRDTPRENLCLDDESGIFNTELLPH